MKKQVFLLLLLLAPVLITWAAPARAGEMTNAAGKEVLAAQQLIMQQATPYPSPANPEETQTNPAYPRPPQEYNPGLIVGGIILFLIVIAGVLFSMRRRA